MRRPSPGFPIENEVNGAPCGATAVAQSRTSRLRDFADQLPSTDGSSAGKNRPEALSLKIRTAEARPAVRSTGAATGIGVVARMVSRDRISIYASLGFIPVFLLAAKEEIDACGIPQIVLIVIVLKDRIL